MAKHFNCWSEALERPVTVIKSIENDTVEGDPMEGDPLEDDSNATFNDSNNGDESEYFF